MAMTKIHREAALTPTQTQTSMTTQIPKLPGDDRWILFILTLWGVVAGGCESVFELFY
jgi:hypothetical protein